MNRVARKELTEAKLKKAFRMKLFGVCKTRTKKSSPDRFNFYVIWANHDMAGDTGRATTCRRNFKAPWLQTERTKVKGLLKEWVLTWKLIECSRQKFQKFHSPHGEANKRTTWPWGQKLNKSPCKQEDINWSKIEKIIQNETVGTLQD